jgi:hypothetical protein
MIKSFVIARAIGFLIAYVDANWEALVAQGKEKVLAFLRTFQNRFAPDSEKEEGLFGSDPTVVEFGAQLDQVIERAEKEAA